MSVSFVFTLALESLLSKPPVKTKKAELIHCLLSFSLTHTVNPFIHTGDVVLHNVSYITEEQELSNVHILLEEFIVILTNQNNKNTQLHFMTKTMWIMCFS